MEYWKYCYLQKDAFFFFFWFLFIEWFIVLLQTWDLYEKNELVFLVDTALNGNFDAEEACRFLKIGLLCTQEGPKLRPSMSTIVKMLKGELNIDDRTITKPGLISDFMDLKVRGPPTTMAEPKNSYDDDAFHSSDNSNLWSGNTSSATTSTFTASYERST